MKNSSVSCPAHLLLFCSPLLFLFDGKTVSAAPHSAVDPLSLEYKGTAFLLLGGFFLLLVFSCCIAWAVLSRRQRRIVEKQLEACRNELETMRHSLVQLEESALSMNALVHGILNAIPDMIFFKDAEGRYRLCNQAFSRYTGYPEEEILGKNDRELFAHLADDSELYNAMDKRAVETGKPCSNEEEITYPDGAKRLMETIKTPYYNSRGTLLGVIATTRDITERKKTEESLRQARQEAEQANRAKSDFLANMSHEIRTPLNGILGLCYLASRQQCPPELREYVRKIEYSSQQLMGVINGILDFSKIEAGRMTLESVPFRLKEVLNNTLTLLKPGAEKQKIDLCCELDPQLPEKIVGDSLRLQQIMLNLAGNAIKFTASGGVALSLTLGRAANAIREEMTGPENVEDRPLQAHPTTSPHSSPKPFSYQDAFLKILVEDTGIGMDKAMLSNIFTPFSQAEKSTTRRYGGTGLGLSITKNLVMLMGGQIAVFSTPEQGTTFCVELPLICPETMESTEKKQPSTDRIAEAGLQGIRVLLAEDNTINQLIIREILELHGAEVDTVANGREALKRALAVPHDILLMDIQMPEMDGIESARQLRKNPALDATPILALSACALEWEQKESLSAGMQAHITKPVDPEQLCAAIAFWVETFRKPFH